MADDSTTGHVWDEDLARAATTRCRAGGWCCSSSPWSFGRRSTWRCIRAWAAHAGKLGWTSDRAVRGRAGARRRRGDAPRLREFDGQPAEVAGDGPAGAWPSASACSSTTAPPCHGSDARGSKGFPNLTDRDWLLRRRARRRSRRPSRRGAHGIMPPMAAAVGGGEDVRNVAHYVLSLSGSPHNPVKAPARQARSSPPARPATAWAAGQPGAGRAQPHRQGLAARAASRPSWASSTRARPTHDARARPAADADEQIHVLAAYVWGLSTQLDGSPDMDSPPSLRSAHPDRRAAAGGRASVDLRCTRSRRRSTRASVHGLVRRRGAGRWCGSRSSLFYGLPLAAVERPPGGAVRPGARAASTSSTWCCTRRTSST